MTIVQKTAHEWMTDLYEDTNNKDGYIVNLPKGLYGKKVKELVNYFSQQSVELKAIRDSRRTKPNVIFQYVFYIFQFLSEYVFPIAFAVLASYMYYSQEASHQHPPPVFTPSPPPRSFEPSPKPTVTFDVFLSWMPSAADAGKWLGSNIRTVLSVPVSFVVNTLDRGLHVQEVVQTIQTNGSKFVLIPLLFITVYIITKLVCRLLVHIQTLCASQRRVWNLQQIIIQETEEALERGITGIMRPFLLNNFEDILTVSVSSSIELVAPKNSTIMHMVRTYQGNLPLMRMNLIDRIATAVKQMPFAELVKRGGLSPSYNQALRQLVRHADDELSNTMFTFHEEIHKVSDSIQTQLVGMGQYATRSATRVANTLTLAPF